MKQLFPAQGKIGKILYLNVETFSLEHFNGAGHGHTAAAAQRCQP